MKKLISGLKTLALSASLLGALSLNACNSPDEIDDVGTAQQQLADAEADNCATLYAGQNIDAGTVCVERAGDSLDIVYSTVDGWQLTEAHAYVGDSLEDMPQTPNGNPKIGNFPYNSGDLAGATAFTFTVALDDIVAEGACDIELAVAAHAALQKADGSEMQTETGWAGVDQINEGGSWARWFSYTLPCCEKPPAEAESCETAYAFGDTTFIDLGLTQSRWGWEVGPIDAGSQITTPIFAGAGQNDVSKGTEVGLLEVNYDGAQIKVRYALFAGFSLQETHLYVGAAHVGTIAPGQLGQSHDLSDAAEDTFTLSGFNGEPLNLVAHGVVCSGGEDDDTASTEKNWDIAKNELF